MKLLNTDTLEEAREKLWKETADMELETCEAELREARGRISSRDIFSEENIPPFDRSTMDGYALATEETYGAGESSPVFLHVCGKVRIEEQAGASPGPGEAVQVQTGSMIPKGADAVVMAEYTEEYAPGRIICCRPVSPGENVIRAGEDIYTGERIICRGQQIGVGETGMLAGIGIRRIQVYRKPVVTVISTGDELAGAGEPLTAGMIRDINTDALTAAAESCGMDVRAQIRIGDEREKICHAVQEASGNSDIVLISGGSSKGSRDFTEQVLEKVTGNVFTHGIALRPGKPTILAYDRERKTVITGLPGHPMAAVLVFRLVIAHWYRRKTGMDEPLSVPAVMGQNVSSNQGRETCLPVRLIRSCEAESNPAETAAEGQDSQKGQDGYTALPVYAKSGSISALAGADAYVMIPRDREGLKKGERIWAELL